MKGSIDDSGIKIDDTLYLWSNIKRVDLVDRPNGITDFYIFGTSLLISFNLNLKENSGFLNDLVTKARGHGIVVEALPKGMQMCPTCGNFVAHNAMNCPTCGYVFRVQKSGGVGIIGIVIAILIAVFVLSVG